MTRGGILGLMLTVGGGCAGPPSPPRAVAADGAASTPAAPARPGPRWFQSATDGLFFVTHDADLDRVVVDGVRVEVASDGRVRRVAVSRVDLRGSLAAPARLGGGYLHWSQDRVFRSDSFTGPLSPVPLPAMEEREIRAVQAGLDRAVVISDVGAYGVSKKGDEVIEAPAPGLADVVALDASRQIELDVFARGRVTSDGGRSFRSIDRAVGNGIRSVGRTESALWIDAWQRQFELRGPTLEGPTAVVSGQQEFARGEIRFEHTRKSDEDRRYWGPQPVTMLQAAVRAGVAEDGGALGLTPDAMGVVDLDTGRARAELADPFHNGLLCEPMAAPDATVFACRWEQYQHYGGYVLRAQGAAPPVLEHAFSDDGVFVGTEDGALLYTGRCEPTFRDPEDGSGRSSDEELPEWVCVRHAGRGWVERRLPDLRVLRWIPRVDGTVVAITDGDDPALSGLPPRLDAAPRSAADGVTVVRAPRLADGLEVERLNGQDMGSRQWSQIQRDFDVDEDGTLRGWAQLVEGRAYESVRRGLTVEPDGRAAVFDLPSRVDAITVTGRFGLARSEDGDLFETTDHGGTWARVGRSPVPASAFLGGCSRFGCALGSFVRVGWGNETVAVDDTGARVEEAVDTTGGRLDLRCRPTGLPSVTPGVGAARGSSRVVSIGTGYGDVIGLTPLADEDMDEGDSDPSHAGPRTVTHRIEWVPPFSRSGEPVRHEVVMADIRNPNGVVPVPLVSATGTVGLLLAASDQELLLTDGRLRVLPAFEPDRYVWRQAAPTSGVLTAAGAEIVGFAGQRVAIEGHGDLDGRLPRYFGLERGEMQRRHLALAVKAGGERAVLSLNRPTPDPVGAAPLGAHGGVGDLEGLASWTSALPASDPSCRDMAGGYRALLVVDPSGWFSLDERALPGITLGHAGLVEVRWGVERVCVDAIRLSVSSARRLPRDAVVVVRFDGAGAARGERDARRAGGENGTLRNANTLQSLSCELRTAARRGEGGPR